MTDALPELWTPCPLSADAVQHWRIGTLEFWITYRNNECRIAHRWGTEAPEGGLDDSTAKPDDLPWARYALRVAAPTIVLRPRMPDRSVIVRPAAPLTIFPGQEVVFFVSIPPWIQVELLGQNALALALFEAPVIRLSNSWFGTPIDGELCYALKTRALRVMDEQRRMDRVVCPLQIRNASSEPLLFDRLALKVAHLAVFQGQEHLWTNLGELVHQGNDALTRINLKPGAPPYDQAGRQLADAREHPEKRLMLRAFGSLRAFNPFWSAT